MLSKIQGGGGPETALPWGNILRYATIKVLLTSSALSAGDAGYFVVVVHYSFMAFQDRSESEGAVLREISSARKDAATVEKTLHSTLLRTAETEEKAKKEVWTIKKQTAEYELKMAKLQTSTLETENYTALVKRNIAIVQYNQLGNHIPVPPLPPPPPMGGNE